MKKRFGMAPYWRGGVPVERGQYPAVLEWRPQRERTDNPEIFQGWIADIEAVLATAGLSLVTQQTGGGTIIYSAAGHRVAELRKTMSGFEGTVFSRPVGGPGPGARGAVAAEEIRRSSTWLGYGKLGRISVALPVPPGYIAGHLSILFGVGIDTDRKFEEFADWAATQPGCPSISGVMAEDDEQGFCQAMICLVSAAIEEGYIAAHNAWKLPYLWRHWLAGAEYETYEVGTRHVAVSTEYGATRRRGVVRGGSMPSESGTTTIVTAHFKGLGGETFTLAPHVRAQMQTAEAVDVLPFRQTTPEDESLAAGANPNSKKISPAGPIAIGAGVLGGVLTAVFGKKIGVAGQAIAGVASAAAGVSGTVKTVLDAKKKSDIDEILDGNVPPALVNARVAAIPMERDLRDSEGKGFACLQEEIPKIVAEVSLSPAFNHYHRPHDERDAAAHGGDTSGFWWANRYLSGSCKASWPRWYERIYGIDGDSLDPLITAGVKRLHGIDISTGNWAICGRIRHTYEEPGDSINPPDERHGLITFIEEGGDRVLCYVKYSRYIRGGKYRDGLDPIYIPDWDILPGDYGTVPDVIVINGMANNYTRAVGGGPDTDPFVLTPTAPDSEKLPMSAVQILYKLLRTYSPMSISMAGHPFAWAFAVLKHGDKETVTNGWTKIFDTVKVILGIASTVASVCYPALTAIAPAAIATISNIANGIIENVTDVQLTVHEVMGDFSRIDANYEEIFSNWAGTVMADVGVPTDIWEMNPTKRMEKLVNTEFGATVDGLFSNWIPFFNKVRGEMEYPTTPFYVHSLKQFIPPIS